MSSAAVEAYRKVLVQADSPVGLVVMLYDTSLTSLRRAIDAAQRVDIQQRTEHLNHVLEVVGHLQSTLDMERGGEVSHILWAFYAYIRRQLLAASFDNSVELLSAVETQIATLRDAWRQVDQSIALQ